MVTRTWKPSVTNGKVRSVPFSDCQRNSKGLSTQRVLSDVSVQFLLVTVTRNPGTWPLKWSPLICTQIAFHFRFCECHLEDAMIGRRVLNTPRQTVVCYRVEIRSYASLLFLVILCVSGGTVIRLGREEYTEGEKDAGIQTLWIFVMFWRGINPRCIQRVRQKQDKHDESQRNPDRVLFFGSDVISDCLWVVKTTTKILHKHSASHLK